MNNHKQMAYDDIFFSSVLLGIGIFGLRGEHQYASSFMVVFGALWLGIRIYHLTHQKEVFGEDS